MSQPSFAVFPLPAASVSAGFLDAEPQRYDVVVLGAGPAGSVASLLAARGGLRVLLVERQIFPRSKVCGCCLNQRAQQLLRLAGLDGVLRDLQPVSTDMLRIQRGGRCLELPVPGGVAVSRRLLDQRLVQAATAAGVEFVEDGTAVVAPLSESREGLWRRVSLLRTSGGGAALRPVSGIAESASSSGDYRPTVRLCDSLGRQIEAGVVLACDGLGHSSLARLPEFQSRPFPGARIGLGAVCDRTESDGHFRRHEIVMAVGRDGYVGVVHTEDDRLNLAAAVDGQSLHRAGSPLACLSGIFLESGVRPPEGLAGAVIRGTPPLSRRSPRLTGHRLLLLGDATGYVEPFTGEGMAWALTAAVLSAPLVQAAAVSGWSDGIEQQYERVLRAAVGREQHICRVFAKILRHPVLSAVAMTAARLCPWAVRSVVHRINRLPQIPEKHFETV